HAQQPDAVLLDSSKPTIYLTFERFGEDDSVFLRLHNNTRWAISFRTERRYDGASVETLTLNDGRQLSGLVDGLQVIPEYFIEHAAERITTNGQYWCTSSKSWLAAGRSLVFSFPRKVLKEWEQIYIKFTYEWERGDYDPEHKVSFHGFDLSKLK
ncbi:MAG: hypothetical protein ICV60_18790, partial [Pyrinomonadaceae bacterium]|nr:hypothetical protein [Pyrinomonadaceae bacterium]